MMQYGTDNVQESILKKILSNINYLSTNQYGCRIVQMSLEVFTVSKSTNSQLLLNQLKEKINMLTKVLLMDKNGNYVL